MKRIFVLFFAVALTLSSCKSSKYPELGDGLFAEIQTTKGDMVIKLEYEKTPVTVANFVSLAEGESTFVSDEYKGKRYFDSLIFHRVMKDFMIQGGDPLGNGTGGPGYKFMDEFDDSLLHDRKGVVSMANPGPPDTNGSQFFITHKETPWLNGKHSIFGELVLGFDVLDSIANTPVEKPSNKPTTDVVINRVEIIRNGSDASNFDALAVMTDYFSKEGERLAKIEKENAAKMAAVQEIKKAFVAELENQKAKAKSLPSGLKILNLTAGSGDKPKQGAQVFVKYAGYLEDGALFDSNYEDVATLYNKFDQRRKDGGGYEPIPMPYSPDAQLIAGFREGLLTMKVGDKIRVFIPSHLGYGPQGSRNVIPPNADLVFDLEITGIVE